VFQESSENGRNVTDEPGGEALFRELAQVGKAFSSEKRLRLLGVLAQGERTVEALAQAVGLGVTTASSHLQILRSSGLITARRDGTRVYYRLAGDDVAALFVALRSVAAKRSASVERELGSLFASHGADSVSVITRNELRARGDDQVVLLDVRPTDEFRAGHIPGARSVPLAELPTRVGELGTDAEIVAYCRGAHCVMAYDAVHVLRAHEVAAQRLEDGMIEWQLAGLPVEVGA
jgi:rhodanese-related sulfurtransferase/DNA-binding transcriptional ArsR family regulator